MFNHIPAIIQAAAWVYVIKQVLPFILFPAVVVGTYTLMRVNGLTHRQAMKLLGEGVKN